MGIAPSTLAAILAASSAAAPAVLPATGLLSEWRFSEGSGTTVADEQGTYPINLSLPTNPNATWTAQGLSLADGLVQTPTITGLRTVAVLYRVAMDASAGFIFSGGQSANTGWNPNYIGTLFTAYSSANQHAMNQVRASSAGAYAYELNRGGWVLGIATVATAYNTPLAFGGKHSTTTTRCADFGIAWAAAWSGVLDDTQRAEVYAYVRQAIATPRGIYIHWQDAPTTRDAIMLWGQSNADGRAQITNLSAGEQATSLTGVSVSAGNYGSRSPVLDQMVLGVNQQRTAPVTDFGPEVSMAWRRLALSAGNLSVVKTANGSMYLASKSVGAPVTASNTWSTDDADMLSSGMFHAALRDYYTAAQNAATAGVGLRMRALVWVQGEQDATQTVASAAYEADLTALIAQARARVSPALRLVVSRTRADFAGANATAAAQVRAAQAAVVAADSDAVLYDADSLSRKVDAVHYDAAGQAAHGLALYDAAFA